MTKSVVALQESYSEVITLNTRSMQGMGLGRVWVSCICWSNYWLILRTVDLCVITKKEIHMRSQELWVRPGYNIQARCTQAGPAYTALRSWRWHGQMIAL